MSKEWTGNKQSVFVTLGASNHAKSEREKDDFYATDPSAIDRLLKVYKLPNRIWEPACGSGCLSKRLVELGHEVVSTDLYDRGYGQPNVNFLEQLTSPFDGDYAIVTNPPYKYVTDFVLHALRLAPVVAMFCKKHSLKAKADTTRFSEIPHPVMSYNS